MILFQILVILFCIGILVFIHELGHFIMAKLFRMKVEKFAFGFGPEIVGFNYKNTRYCICIVPLGGMVKLPGENIEEATGAPDEFYSQPWYKRAIMAFFGPLMNYMLAIVLFAAVIFYWGIQEPVNQPVIGGVLPSKPAEKIGLKSGDKILSIDNTKITTWQQIASIISKKEKKKLKFKIQRENKILTFYITPEYEPVSEKAIIGITPAVITKKINLISSIWLGTKTSIFQTVFTLDYLIKKIIKLQKPEVSGPIGVAQILANATEAGIEKFLYILGIISAALGLFNLLPIPLVDGGHIMFSFIEALTHKPINKKIIQTANTIGLAIIITIFVLATYNDILRIGTNVFKNPNP